MIRVLFVCLGNICRSPMAEALFRDLVRKKNLQDQIMVESAGIGHWHSGSVPHKGTRDILDEHQVSYEGMVARQVEEADWDRFDYIIAMDEANIQDLKAIREKNDVVVGKLLDYAEKSNEIDVPDPYFTGNFHYVYKLVIEGCLGLLAQIKQDHQLS